MMKHEAIFISAELNKHVMLSGGSVPSTRESISYSKGTDRSYQSAKLNQYVMLSGVIRSEASRTLDKEITCSECEILSRVLGTEPPLRMTVSMKLNRNLQS